MDLFYLVTAILPALFAKQILFYKKIAYQLGAATLEIKYMYTTW